MPIQDNCWVWLQRIYGISEDFLEFYKCWNLTDPDIGHYRTSKFHFVHIEERKLHDLIQYWPEINLFFLTARSE